MAPLGVQLIGFQRHSFCIAAFTEGFDRLDVQVVLVRQCGNLLAVVGENLDHGAVDENPYGDLPVYRPQRHQIVQLATCDVEGGDLLTVDFEPDGLGRA